MHGVYKKYRDNLHDVSFDRNNVSELFRDTDFLRQLRVNHIKGTRYFVVSYGNQELIIAYLKGLGIFDLFTDIYTPSTFGHDDYYDITTKVDGKNEMLRLAQDTLHFVEGVVVANNNVTLVDDSDRNIERARAKGYQTVEVTGGNGLTLAYKDAVLNPTGHF